MSISTLKIITNNVPRDIINWWDLTEKEKKDFDWIENPDESGESFVRYNKNCYCLSEFMRIENNSDLKGWNGYNSDSYFSGILIKIVNDCEQVIMGRYYS